MLKIGKIQITNPFIQAALAGYTDRAMRMLARKFGCELVFSGVILDKCTSYKPLFERPNYIIKDDEHPIGAQLLGTEPEQMATAAKNMVKTGYDIIDLNFACPAPKVLRKARGGALMAEPQKVLEIFKTVRDAVSCPVMMKLRIGTDDSAQAKENFWYIAENAVKSGVDGIILHGRTVEQRFKGFANWETIKQFKEKFPQTTIIGSGDLFDPSDIVNKFKTAGVDGVAVARGAIGKPWIFRQIADVVEGKAEIYKPDLKTQGQIILEHFDMLKELYDARKCIWYFRKFLSKYCTSHNTIKKARREFVAIRDEAHLREIIARLYGC